MAITRIPVPNLLGGVSRQPQAARHTNQLEAMENFIPSLAEGLTKRPGSWRIAAVADLAADADLRLHPIDRDGGEQYLVVYGEGVLRVLTVAGVECLMGVDTAAWEYLAAGSAACDQLRPATIADYTLIANTTVAPALADAPHYAVADEWATWDILASRAPADGTVFYAAESAGGFPTGHYRHDTGPGTWAAFRTRTFSGAYTTPSTWQHSGRNPGGYKIAFEHTAMTYGSGDQMTWTAASRRLSKAGAFADYTFADGDQIHISGGTTTTSGWIAIDAKEDDDALILADSIHASNQTDIETDGIGREYEVIQDLQRETFADLHDVAAALQRHLRQAGAGEALVGWTYTTATDGYLTITSPYRGSQARVHHPTAPSSGYNYLVIASPDGPFRNSGSGTTLTAGTGSPRTHTMNPLDRWTRLAAPGQRDAVIDAATMPVALIRRHLSGFYGADYASVVLADEPVSYWRLGESAGGTAADVMRVNDGTYANAPTLGAASLLERGTDTAVTLNGTDQYVDCGDLGSFASDCNAAGATLEAWVKTSGGQSMCIMGVIKSVSSSVMHLWYSHPTGKLRMQVGMLGVGAPGLFALTDAGAGIDDGHPHHVVGVWDALRQTVAIYVDGRRVPATQESYLDYWTRLEDFTYEFYIGASRDGAEIEYPFVGTLDEAAVYARPLTGWEILSHYRAGAAATVPAFELGLVDWTDRLSGDTATNPAPSLLAGGKPIADVTFHRNRLVLVGDEHLLLSQAGDFFNLWLDDAENIGDADPIDIALSADRVTLVNYVVPFRRILVVFTLAGQQFELNAPETLTPNTAAVTPSTAETTLPTVRPDTMGDSLYMAAAVGDAGRLLEYAYSDVEAANTAADVAAHAHGYLPAALKTVAAAPAVQSVLVVPAAGDGLYVYRRHIAGDELVQSAWSRWTLDDDERLVDAAVIADDAYALIENDHGYFLARYPLAAEGPQAGMAAEIALDHRQAVSGVHGGGYTTWTYGIDDATIDAVVLGAGFGDDAGAALADVEASGTDAVRVEDAAGEYAGQTCYVGRGFTASATLSQIFRRDNQGVAALDDRVHLKTLAVNAAVASSYTVRAVRAGVARDTAVAADGTRRAYVNAPADDVTLTILDASHHPLTIASAEVVADITRRRA